MRVTILGCGGSMGVPSSLGDWGICDPGEPRNFRRRPAVMVETETPDGEPRVLLIDTPPELREQLAGICIPRIDAVLFTHAHADHVHGIDDLRAYAYRQRERIDIHIGAPFYKTITERFAYCIEGGASGAYRPILRPHLIDGPFQAAGVSVVPFVQDHGFGPSTGFRIGNFAYSIDVVRLPDASFGELEGISHWVIDCQQIEPHPTHCHLDQTLDWIARVAPKRSILSHMGPKLDYRTISKALPSGVEPGYDGLSLEI